MAIQIDKIIHNWDEYTLPKWLSYIPWHWLWVTWDVVDVVTDESLWFDADLKLKVSTVDNVTSTSETKPLSAKQWKILQDQINMLASRWRYLSDWDCETWLAVTLPTSWTTYTYNAWDYFIVTNTSTTNYRPNWSQYVVPAVASTTVETWDVAPWDTYTYDWSLWILQSNHWAASFASITGDPYDNIALWNALDTKLDKTSNTNKVYWTDNSWQQTEIWYSSSATASTIPLRWTWWVVSVGTPTADTHAATKKYVDDAIDDLPDPIQPGNWQLIIQKNWTAITPTWWTFTANKSTNSTVNITVPVDDVQVDNTSVVDNNWIAKIDLSWLVHITWEETITGKKIFNWWFSATSTNSDLWLWTVNNDINIGAIWWDVNISSPIAQWVTQWNVIIHDLIAPTANNDAATKKYVDDWLTTKQPTLVSWTNIKTINSTSLLWSWDIQVQPTLVNQSNIKSINWNSLLWSWNLEISWLPTQTWNTWKFLQTNWTSASWKDPNEFLTQAQYDALTPVNWITYFIYEVEQ